MGLTLGITGLQDFDSVSVDFVNAATALEDKGGQDGMLKKVAQFILGEVDQQFETSGAYQIAGGFAPLSPIYEEIKSQQYPGQPILTATGEYRESWSQDPEPGGGRIIHSGLEDTRHLWHEFGDVNHHMGPLPERPVLMITAKTLDAIDEMFLTDFDDRIMAVLAGG